MPEISLTRGHSTLVDPEDMNWLSQWSWHANPGTVSNIFYARRTCRTDHQPKMVYMHRLICGVTGDLTIDHINYNTLDNRRANLRICSIGMNVANRRTVNRSGYRGVCYSTRRQKYEVSITVSRSRRTIGYFADPVAAATAYDEAALKAFGDYAVLNFPLKPSSVDHLREATCR